MGLLTPVMLSLAALAAVPLVLHLLQRHQGPRVMFPAIRYLRRAERESARRIRLRQILLLALRVAAIVLLAAAAARPFVRAGGGAHHPTAVVLVLDNSLSSGAVVGDARVLDALRARARETLAAAGPDDRVWLLLAGEPWLPAETGAPAALAARLEGVEPSDAAGDLAAAIERARSILAVGAEGRAPEIHLLSDAQRSALTTGVAGDDEIPIVAWVPDGDAPGNAGVVEAQPAGGFAPRTGERTAILARTAGAGIDSTTLRLTIDGRPRAAVRAEMGAPVSLPLGALPSGALAGEVEIEPDALRGDDARAFAAIVQPPPAVALASPLAFVEQALAVLADAGRIRRVTGDAAAHVTLAPAGVGADAIRRGGAVVVIPPTSPVELPAANRRLAAAGIPWRYGPSADAGVATLDPASLPPGLRGALAEARLALAHPLEPVGAAARDDTVHARLRGGGAWAVAGATERGRYVVLASPLTPEASTLPTGTALVPLLDHALGAWSATTPPTRDVAVGETIALAGEATSVTLPDGDVETVEGGAPYRARARGVYRVLAGDSLLEVFAANPPAAETPLARFDADVLEARLDGWDVETASDAGTWREEIYVARLGYELWPWLLAAALVVLIAEAAVAAGGRARAPAEAPSAAKA